MKILLLLLSVSGLFAVSGCSSWQPLPARTSAEQNSIMGEIRNSLGQRYWTFDALLAKAGNPPYYQRKAGKAPGELNDVTEAREFAPGVSETDVRNVGVNEYAFFLGAAPGGPPGTSSYRCVRVFVRKGRVIYVESTSLAEEDFWYYFERVP
jgi:hypothetical protein